MSEKSILVGEGTSKLLHDIETLNKRQTPVSAWTDRNYILNGSTYEKSFFDGQFVDIIYYNIGILPFFEMMCMVVLQFKQNVVFILSVARKNFGRRTLLVFLMFNVLLSSILVFGGWSTYDLMKKLFGNISQWIENRFYDATDMLTIHINSRSVHPFTMGLSPPFYLYTFRRYPMEDVVFKCEFETNNIKAIYKSTKWRKNGSPLRITDDRVYVNVTHTKYTNPHTGLPFYRILSVLTIQLLEESDYASYTCEYHNPVHVVVLPGPLMSEEFTKQGTKRSHPMSPDPKCDCKPKPQNTDTCSEQKYIEESECFSEFILQKPEEKVITKSLVPGSIFIENVFYSTVTGIEDVEIEIPQDDNSNEENCCSTLITTYWRFFKGGGILSAYPPFTRTIVANDGLYFMRYRCMCLSNYGTNQFKIIRNFVSKENGKKDRVEIVYPVKHNLLPIFSSPWTSTQTDSFTGTQADAFRENSCLGTDSSAQGCGVFNQLFKSSTESLFFYEHVLLIVIIASVAFIITSICCVVRQRCVRPLLSAILYFNKTETTFESANGVPVKKTTVLAASEERKSYEI
ncbi:hypothetical protein BgiBS90_004885 [Biomphalaria glabrata]|nr:hypothetical protein BgiBS90_004885 [Biomphalaria glabrata]